MKTVEEMRAEHEAQLERAKLREKTRAALQMKLNEPGGVAAVMSDDRATLIADNDNLRGLLEKTVAENGRLQAELESLRSKILDYIERCHG